MKYIVTKLFWDYENEEKWLNEMSAKGYGLVSLSLGKYTFEEQTPSIYTYRIELLDKLPSHPDTVEYLNCLEYKGIEVVQTHAKWAYYRKRASEGEFELFKDVASKKKHYERVFFLFYIIMLSNFFIGVGNIIVAFKDNTNTFFSIFIGAVILALGAVIGINIVLPIYRKIKLLKKQAQIKD